MFHIVDFTKLGGFPLTQNAMEFIQQSYNDVLEAIARMAGQYVILTGVTTISPNVYSDGWVVIDGQIMPFIGGVGQSFVNVTPTYSGLTFNDATVQTVYTINRATFASSGIPFSSFKRLTLESLKTQIDAVSVVANNAYNIATGATGGGSFLPGMIIMWSGVTPPSGWGLCDGLDGRPNLKGKFIVGYDAGDSSYDAIGDTGGEATHTLSVGEMPVHTHVVNSGGAHSHTYHDSYLLVSGTGGANPKIPGTIFEVFSNVYLGIASVNVNNDTMYYRIRNTSTTPDHTHGLGNAGGVAGVTQAHENRPPFYTLAYIIKL